MRSREFMLQEKAYPGRRNDGEELYRNSKARLIRLARNPRIHDDISRAWDTGWFYAFAIYDGNGIVPLPSQLP